MPMIDRILQSLNAEQIKPVLDTEGAVLVIAGAGSGKTRVLTSRIAYLIEEKGVSPSNIMAITFTNKAANEMRERLTKIVGNVGDMWVSTIHSMCVRILRRDIDKIGYDKNFSIYDETDKDKALKRIFEELALDADSLMKSAKNHISMAKNECMTPEDYKKANSGLHFIDEICKVYEAYEKYLARSNSLDFDDLLFRTYELFKKCPSVADYYANKFQYIHIDEFQDTNTVQFAIAERLAITHGNIFVVGDDDQSIYGWRGAKIENILNFDDKFRGAKIYKLQQNYRSTKKILSLANKIIANNTERRPKELWTENEDGVKIEFFVGDEESMEASFTAMQIKSLMARNNYSYKDFAIFMRVNALSRAFEQELNKYAIPYRVFGGFKFFERKEIKDVLAYLKLVNNFYDDEAFLRAVSVPKRGIGDKTLRELREFCYANGIPLYIGISRLDETTIGNAAKTKLFNFKVLIDSFRAYSINNPASKLINYILESTGFMEQFAERNEENDNRKLNIHELVSSAISFENDNDGATLSDYLNSVTLSSDTDALNADDAVTIATIHAAKGLEYKCVFVAGLDERILPISRANDDPSELEEERRLMYVAVTRAKERLYLTRAKSRYMYGKRDDMSPSRFLKEGEIIKPKEERKESAEYRSYGRVNYGDDNDFGTSQTNVGGYSSSYVKSYLQEKPRVVKTQAQFSAYKTGVKVRHTKFGEGTVIMVKGSGDNTIVDVAFKGVGVKSLSAKFAPMEII